MYRLLAEEPYRGRILWDRVHVFWGDERHVPPDHPDSNFGMAHDELLSKVPLPPDNIHRVRAEKPDAERAAHEYEWTLRSACIASTSSLAPERSPVRAMPKPRVKRVSDSATGESCFAIGS